MAEVVVVIVNYNAGAWLRDCLAALRAQTFTEFSAVVVDNGSTDGSELAVDSLGDARFELLRAGRNLGFAAACNAGAARAMNTAYVALLNPDAFPAPGWLHELIGEAAKNPRAGALGCKLVDARDPSRCDGTGDEYHASGRAWRRDHGAPVAVADTRPAGEVFAACAAAALYRRDAWDAAGGLDEDFFCYMEDVDLSFRLRLAGWSCLYVPTAVCRHVGSATTGRRSDFSVYHGQRNLVWVFVKNMPGALFWVLLPLHLILNVAALAMFLMRGQFAVALRAKRDAISRLRPMWRKRARIQSARAISARALWRCLDKRVLPPMKAPS